MDKRNKQSGFKDLNKKKWEKLTMLPLIRHVLNFRNFVTKVANKASALLVVNTSHKTEYKKLVDSTLILTIICKRKRIGDVQYTIDK